MDATAITQRTRDTALITAQRRIMAAVIQERSALRFTIGHTIAAQDIGRAVRITSGNLATGYIETVRKSGDAVITSCADIDGSV